MSDFGPARAVFPGVYQDNDVRIVNFRIEDYWSVYDLSDGTHWFHDDVSHTQLYRSLVDVDWIAYDAQQGWLVIEGYRYTPLRLVAIRY